MNSHVLDFVAFIFPSFSFSCISLNALSVYVTCSGSCMQWYHRNMTLPGNDRIYHNGTEDPVIFSQVDQDVGGFSKFSLKENGSYTSFCSSNVKSVFAKSVL